MKGIKTFWIWVLLIFFALFLLSSNLGKKRSWNPAEQVIVEIVAPFQKIIKKTVQAVDELWLKYFGLINTRNENLRMKKEIDALKIENSRFRELLATHQRLQSLLQFKKTINQPVLAAQVIGRDPTGWFESVIIDKGKRSGLKVNMPVVNAQGVVGRLVSVSGNYAKVLLIIDQNSAVDCIIQRSRDNGIVKGLSLKVCELDYVLKANDVIVGDMVVTSGLGRVFPKGVPVGKVIEVVDMPGDLFRGIKVSPMVDFSKLEELLVHLIRVGFAVLTFSLVTGLVFIEDLFGQHLAHKTILSIFAWLIFALLLWGRWKRGWRGQVAVRMTLAGIAVLLLSYFGSKLVLEVILERSWHI